MEKTITKLCNDGDCCPIVSVNGERPEEKWVKIADDFGNKIFMSREQLNTFVEKARNGELSEF